MEKKKMDREALLELIVVILLGVSALCTAWASWIGSLHGGNQATNYTVSNNQASEGNSEYNAGVQQMNQDMLLWNDVSDMQMAILFAKDAGDQLTLDKTCYQLFYKLDENLSESMAESIGWSYQLSQAEYDDPTATVLAWMEGDAAMTSPFFDEEYTASYFAAANDLLAQSQATLEQGRKDNANGDAFGLVTVIYSVVLFLLGISGSFKSIKNKYALVAISLVAFAGATIYMLTLPLPTGFSLLGFFEG